MRICICRAAFSSHYIRVFHYRVQPTLITMALYIHLNSISTSVSLSSADHDAAKEASEACGQKHTDIKSEREKLFVRAFDAVAGELERCRKSVLFACV